MNTYIYKPINMQETGKRIKAFRKAKNFTLEELSEYLSISPQAISKWQRGDALPSIDNLMVLCDIFETHVEDLIVRDDDRSSLFHYRLVAMWGKNRYTFYILFTGLKYNDRGYV